MREGAILPSHAVPLFRFESMIGDRGRRPHASSAPRTRSGRVLSALRRHLGIILLATSVIVLLAGAGFAALEDGEVSNYGEGVWWALSLMTTVGFIGQAPQTSGGQVLSAVLMILGFGLLSIVTAVISSRFVKQESLPVEHEQELFERDATVVLHQLEARLETVARLQQQLAAAIEQLDGREEGAPRPRQDSNLRPTD